MSAGLAAPLREYYSKKCTADYGNCQTRASSTLQTAGTLSSSMWAAPYAERLRRNRKEDGPQWEDERWAEGRQA